MKEYSHIEELLERYYDGKTSVAEEKTLKDFFTKEEIPAHFSAEREMFLQMAKVQPPQGMDQRLEELIDQWDTTERRSIIAASRRRSIRLQWVASIAASLFLLFGAGWYIYKPQPTIRQDTCATPEEAYAQAEKALVMISTALNKGLKQMEVILETTEKAENNLYKQLNKLNNTEL